MPSLASSNPNLCAGCVCMLVAPDALHAGGALGVFLNVARSRRTVRRTVVVIKAAANPRLYYPLVHSGSESPLAANLNPTFPPVAFAQLWPGIF